MIPKTIWQTWKTHELPQIAAAARNTWISKNPGWEFWLVDDAEARTFIEENCSARVLAAYDAMPVPVMKADLWRYAVVHRYGGVYTDLDTSCVVPLDQWIDVGADAVLAPEPSGDLLCQWTFAAAPGSPLLAAVLDLVCERTESGVKMGENRVHHHSGPGVFTDAIWPRLRKLAPIAETASKLTNEDRSALRSVGVQMLGKKWLYNTAVIHHYGGDQWHGKSGYVGWKVDPRARGRG